MVTRGPKVRGQQVFYSCKKNIKPSGTLAGEHSTKALLPFTSAVFASLFNSFLCEKLVAFDTVFLV